MAKRPTRQRKTEARRAPKGGKGKLDRSGARKAAAKPSRRAVRPAASSGGRATSAGNRAASDSVASPTKRTSSAIRTPGRQFESSASRMTSDRESKPNRAASDGGRAPSPAKRAASADERDSLSPSRTGSTSERRGPTNRAVATDDPRVRLERARATAVDELRRLGISGEADDHDPRGTSGAVVEEGDAAQASERRDMSFAQRERLAERINSLTEALGRIADGSYGRCEMCGNPIEPERLAALPEALRCLRCQEELERRGGRREIA